MNTIEAIVVWLFLVFKASATQLSSSLTTRRNVPNEVWKRHFTSKNFDVSLDVDWATSNKQRATYLLYAVYDTTTSRRRCHPSWECWIERIPHRNEHDTLCTICFYTLQIFDGPSPSFLLVHVSVSQGPPGESAKWRCRHPYLQHWFWSFCHEREKRKNAWLSVTLCFVSVCWSLCATRLARPWAQQGQAVQLHFTLSPDNAPIRSLPLIERG